MRENFTDGLNPETLYLLLDKNCCQRTPQGDYSDNVVCVLAALGRTGPHSPCVAPSAQNIVRDTVNGVTKNVLALTAISADLNCPGPDCHKVMAPI